ncbi:MAG: transcription antitermination factor NusB [Dehalococcoidia bacterium]|jgi:N utilization substance protein B
MSRGLRHRARVIALQALFELEFAANSPDDILKRTVKEQEFKGEAADFSALLLHGVIDNKQLLDSTIARYAPTFPVDQLAPMDRNILRLALFEILINKKTPPKVAINEAVELAKEFGADTSPKFVNGVLGSAISELPK